MLIRLRLGLEALLKRTGLMRLAQWNWSLILQVVNPEIREREQAKRKRFLQFKRQYANVLRHHLISEGHSLRWASVIGIDFPEIEAELGLIKGLELADYKSRVIAPHYSRLTPKYYNLGLHKRGAFF